MRDRAPAMAASARATRALFSCLMVGNHEADIMQLHLEATSAHVSAWIVTEATYTHAGLPRTPNKALFKSLRARHGSRLVHVIEHELPCRRGARSCTAHSPHDIGFENEAYQRDLCARHMQLAPVLPKPDDLVLVLDVDEIPSRSQLDLLRLGHAISRSSQKWSSGAECCSESSFLCCDVISIPLRSYTYDLGCSNPSGDGGGARKLAVTWGYAQQLQRWLAQPELNMTGREKYWATVLRLAERAAVMPRLAPQRHAWLPPVEKGYHLSSFGTTQQIASKYLSFSHQEIFQSFSRQLHDAHFFSTWIRIGCKMSDIMSRPLRERASMLPSMSHDHIRSLAACHTSLPRAAPWISALAMRHFNHSVAERGWSRGRNASTWEIGLACVRFANETLRIWHAQQPGTAMSRIAARLMNAIG